MAKNGLDATNYRGWIDNSIEITNELRVILSEFLIGTPAFGLSKKERSLYDYYKFVELEEYGQLYTELFADLKLKFFEKYEELKEAIQENDIMNFRSVIPEYVEEQILIYIGESLKSNFYKAFFKNSKDESSLLKGKKKEQIHNEAEQRKKAVAIDKTFYHLRNGLAHGCFCITVRNDKEYLVLQDESGDCISARMIICLETIKNWISYFHRREMLI